MKWQVEYIADQANILVVDKSKHLSEWEPVGLGLPHGLAERIVKMHNEALEPGQAK